MTTLDWKTLRERYTTKPVKRGRCAHLGKVIGETSCKSCAATGKQKMEALHECALFGGATITRQSVNDGVACCRDCKLYEPMKPVDTMPLIEPAPLGKTL